MKNLYDIGKSWVFSKEMRLFSFILILCSIEAAATFAQSNPPSTALDPNYVILQPAETFKGKWAGQGVGLVISNVGPMTHTSAAYGDVFLNAVDTIGYGGLTIDINNPLGLFQGGPGFSLSNRAKFSLKNASQPILVFNHGKNAPPVIIADSDWTGGLTFAYYPNESYSFTDTGHALLAKADQHPVGGWIGAAAYLNTDTDEDLAMFTGFGDSTFIGIWNAKDIDFHGDTSFYHYPIIRLTRSILVNGPIDSRLSVRCLDLNRDGVPDFVYSDTGRRLVVVFGRRDSFGEWQLDTVIRFPLPFKVSGFLLMDFLWSDGVPDLLLQTDDTIYCYSGAKKDFLRSPLDWLHPDLAIPNPEILDTVNFKGNGKGSYGFVSMFDAGNIDGSGEHSLAVLGGYQPDLSTDFAISYLMTYSGGKAADEKADAIYGNSDAPYGFFQKFDTVQYSLAGPIDMLIGDPVFDMGGVGRLYHISGNSQIPHKPDPRWNNGIVRHVTQVCSSFTVNNIDGFLRGNIVVSEDGHGTIELHDILGRLLYSSIVYVSTEQPFTVSIPITNLPSGTYIVTYRDEHTAIVSKQLILHP